MRKPYFYPVFLLLSLFIAQAGRSQTVKNINGAINNSLEAWHSAAADADYDAYFNLMTKDAVFIGTDAGENWQRKAFMAFAKPYFDKGKAWNFKTLERHIYLSKNKKIAWFDELLDTQMGICRGSGVLKSKNGNWKIAHYVLSITVPNENVEALTQMKNSHDENLIKKLKKDQNDKN